MEEKRSFHCDECDKTYIKRWHLNNHIQRDHKHVRDHVCNICGKGFCSKGELDNHVRGIHAKIKDKICDKCEFKTSRIGDLKRHQRRILNCSQLGEKCLSCSLFFPTQKELKLHARAEHGDTKYFKCPTCDFTA